MAAGTAVSIFTHPREPAPPGNGRRLELGLGMDDLGAAVAFRLGVPGDGAHHVLGQLHGSVLDVADLDPPSFSLRVELALNVGAQALALG